MSVKKVVFKCRGICNICGIKKSHICRYWFGTRKFNKGDTITITVKKAVK